MSATARIVMKRFYRQAAGEPQRLNVARPPGAGEVRRHDRLRLDPQDGQSSPEDIVGKDSDARRTYALDH
jgi:hypothetical protein